MRFNEFYPFLDDDLWNCSFHELCCELQSFIDEFDAFTPELFAQLRFDLFRKGLARRSRMGFCRVAAQAGFCSFCSALYKTKYCLLWFRLFNLIPRRSIQRSPPCIRNAYRRRSIKTVANFLNRINVLDAPFYESRVVPQCETMEEFGYCNPDVICERMSRTNPLEYQSVRTCLRTMSI